MTYRRLLPIILTALLAGVSPGGTLTTRDGKTYSGPLQLRAGEVTVTTDAGVKAVPLAQVALADFKAGGATAISPGHGLRGDYFEGRSLKRQILTRIDPGIDYMWVETLPHPSLAQGNREFSVRWSGYLRADHTEKYTLILNCDDGMRMWVDGKLLVDRWFDQPAGDYPVEVALEKGRSVELRVEFFNSQAGAQAQLSWSSANTPRQVIPMENLLLPKSEKSSAATTQQAIRVAMPSTDGGPAFERVLRPDRTGLKGEYFADREFEHLNFVRFDPNVDFAFNIDNPPDPAMSADGSIRWTGMIEPRFREDYRFFVEANRVRLWVDGKLILDRSRDNDDRGSEPIRLTKGVPVPIKLEFASGNGAMSCHLSWSSPSQGRVIVPPEALSIAPDEKLTRPVIAMSNPSADRFVAAPDAVELAAAALSSNGTVKRVVFYDRNTSIADLDAPPFKFSWAKPPPGVYKLRAKVVDSAGVTALSDVSTLTVTGKGEGSIKAPWGDFYIANGDFKTPGSASQQAGEGAFTIDRAAGTLISETEHDAAHFILQPLTGDGQIIARVASVMPGHDDNVASGMAGVTIRENLKNRCKQFALLYGQSGEEPSATFARRPDHWMSPVMSDKPVKAGAYLKLARHGQRVYAYSSPDGKDWDLIGTERFEAGPEVYVGLVAFNGDANKPATATFDHVKIIPGAPPLESTAKGFVTRGGTFVAADVWGIDDNLVRYGRNNESLTIKLGDVARILYKPLLLDHAEKLSPGRTGVLMSSGDFLEGDVTSVKEGNASVNSVLFGLRKVPIWEDVTAVILHDVSPEKTPFVVTTTDGGLYRAKTIKPDIQTLTIDDASLGQVSVPMSTLSQLRGG